MILKQKCTYMAVLALALGLAGCERGGAPSETAPATGGEPAAAGLTGEPVVIGLAAPLTGSSAAFGTQIKMGVDLAADAINAAGGIDGRPVKVQAEDDTGTAQDANNVATRLASDEKVVAVVGHFNSACSNAGKPIYTQEKVVMLSPGSTAVNVTQGSDYVYRNIFTDDFQGQSLADYASKILGLKKVAVLYDNDDYGIGLKNSFTERAQAIGLEVANATPYNRDAPDFRSQLTAIQGFQPDAVLIAGLYAQAATIAKQARELGLTVPLIGGDGVFSDEYIALAGEAAEGTYVTTPFLFELGGERGEEFAAAFKKKFNSEPDAWAALSYDAFNIVAAGLKAKGATRGGVLEYLKTVDSPENAYDGLTGKTFFDAEGDCKKPVQVTVVKNGKFIAAEKQLSVEDAPEALAAPAAEPAPADADAATTAPAAAN